MEDPKTSQASSLGRYRGPIWDP